MNKTSKFERHWIRSTLSSLTAAAITTGTAAPLIVQATPPIVSTASGTTKPAEDARFADATVQAKVIRKADQLSLGIQTAEGARSADLGDAIERVVAIHRFDNKLIVLGRLADGGATEVRIVDFTNGHVVDKFWGYDPAVSPDASMIAFVRFYPLHFTEGVESQYRLYRLRASAEANRSFYSGQQAGTGHEHADAGQPVFVDGKAKAPRANTGVADAQAHAHLSRLVWSADSRRFGVIDAHGKTVRALVMPVPADGAESAPIAQSVDGLDGICLPARAEDCQSLPFDAVSLAFDSQGDSLRLKINDKSIFPKGFAKTLPLKAFTALP